ncbi:MAG: ATP-dependent DNA helicase RecG, partial [Terriglobia bacterium]
DIVADGESPNSALGANRILPLHPTTQTLSRAKLRRIMRTAVDAFSDVPDPIPAAVRKRYGFVPKGQALRDIHFPQSTEACGAARERLIFEELFLLQTGLALRKKRVGTSVRGIAHKRTGTVARAFYDRLPFSLTQDQKAAISAIARDMDAPHPMSRLVQGEVASGKTVVAVFALLMAVDSGYQGAIMAPTEVLAEQHFLRFSAFLRDLPVKIALLSGGLTGKDKEKTQQAIACGAVDIVVGTQALIQDKVTFKKLGLAVVDEQHRFGVRQRARLKQKTRQSSRRNDWEPDILIMTATPIPRTLSLTLYGDLDVSVIKELPCGRSLEERVETVVWSTARRDAAYARVEEQVARGRQAYIICPLIEESDNVEAKAVLDEAARLKDEVFPNLRVDFIHSRMGTPSKEKIMAAFREHRLDILISTTVVEVGVDVPNATVMVVENAERFGLSQLHQLRGRVGRGKYQSLFVLLSDRATEGAKGRLDAVRDIADGFKLAEKDMELRGEGELLGARQSGLPDLKLAKLSRDMDTLIGAREEAFSLVERDPELKQADHVRLLREVRNRFAGSLDWIFHT